MDTLLLFADSRNSGGFSPSAQVPSYPVSSHEPSEGEKEVEIPPSKSTAQPKTRSLLHNMPGGVDPIAAALIRNREESKIFVVSPCIVRFITNVCD